MNIDYKGQVTELRKAATAIYIAVEESVAVEISRIMNGAADTIERLVQQEVLPSLDRARAVVAEAPPASRGDEPRGVTAHGPGARYDHLTPPYTPDAPCTTCQTPLGANYFVCTLLPDAAWCMTCAPGSECAQSHTGNCMTEMKPPKVGEPA